MSMQNVGSPLADTTKQFILELLFEQNKCESDGCICCYSSQFRTRVKYRAVELKNQLT
jgi:hypothetical protein